MTSDTGREQVALVTGGSRGIGAAVARRLAADGFDIWLNYRADDDAARAVQAEVGRLGRRCELLKFDVADGEAAAAALAARLECATPFVVVNNAGFRRDTLLAMMKPEDWRAVLAVTLDGFFNVTRAVLPGMIHRRSGRVINIASAAAHFGVAGQVNYSAAKAGLLGATRALAAEVARRGVLVNAVSPGFTDTEMLAGLPLEQIRKSIPLGRLGTAEEIAAVVAFLASPAAAYITGQVIQVNGGIGA